jgi:glycosyltransferase involved in cell wall biosynthesis
MCTFNGSRFVAEQLNSIAAQTRLPDELIVCDDRSTDDTREIVNEFADRVPFPVLHFCNEENLGSTANFEKAISLCGGDLIALADQDDMWRPRKLELLERCFLASDDTIAAFSDAEVMDTDGRQGPARLWASVGFNADEQKQFTVGRAWRVLIKHPVVTGATMAFRRELCSAIFPIPREYTHDRWISYLASVSGKVIPVPQALIRYRKHAEQQIGIGPQHIQERLALARRRTEAFYESEIDLLLQLCDRMESIRLEAPYADDAIREARKKIEHLRNRLKLRAHDISRIPEIFREVCTGGYWKYSAGWESVAKDLFLSGAR